MIRALWFMIKVGLLVALAVWVANRPGFVKIEWLDYTFTIHVGLFLLLALATIMLAIFVHTVIRAVIDFPGSYRRYREVRNLEKGYEAVTRGLSAVAAGDAKTAVYQAGRAQKFLNRSTLKHGDGPEDKDGLCLLLQAQAARLEGREDDARKSFLKLLENKDAGFLGVRGLLQAALDTHNDVRALELAHQALALYPKQPWILRLVYTLELRRKDWKNARETLRRAERMGVIDAGKARHDRMAMLLAEADQDLQSGYNLEALKKIKKASALDSSFAPAAARLATLYRDADKKRKAMAVIKKAWKEKPHPDLVPVWQSLIPEEKSKKPVSGLRWFEKLLDTNPHAAAGQLAAARIAIEEGLWGEARHFLEGAEKQEPTAAIYRLRAALEEQAGSPREIVQRWQKKAAEAPPDYVWVCRETGTVYPSWSPVAMPHGSFNTITWSRPVIHTDHETVLPGDNHRRSMPGALAG